MCFKNVLSGFHGMMLGKSIGSGTIIDPDGTILTCAHVVVDFQSTKTVPKGKVCDVYSKLCRHYVYWLLLLIVFF